MIRFRNLFARFQKPFSESVGIALCGVPGSTRKPETPSVVRNAAEGVSYRLSPGIAKFRRALWASVLLGLLCVDDPLASLAQPRPGRSLEQWRRELGAAAVSEDENPLLDIARRMQDVEGRIRQVQTGAETQRLQASILARFDALLQAARSQAQRAASGQRNGSSPPGRQSPSPSAPEHAGASKPGTKPAPASVAAQGESLAPRTAKTAREELLKSVWGELPEHQREQVLELPVEEFLPKYEGLIEAYFRRLAEEAENR